MDKWNSSIKTVGELVYNFESNILIRMALRAFWHITHIIYG